MRFFILLLTCVIIHINGFCHVELGIDRVFSPPYNDSLKGKKIGLITNQTGVNSKLQSTIDLFYSQQKACSFELKALFGPEHGLFGDIYADNPIASSISVHGIPIHSLYGTTRRPTAEMLKGITLLVFDIQDIGSRSYTYISTLFYCMEEAAKQKIPVLVLDRPNPINGLTVDGPMLEDAFRTFVGYINVPYCHGMTIGELARYFNSEYKVGCTLLVVPMKGWKRSMSFSETGLHWIPSSPYVPEATTCHFYPVTGLLGEMQLVSIGIGYTLPFKVVGAPWIQAERFADALNNQKIAGVVFHPTRFKPFAGKFSQKQCQGVTIVITDKHKFLPVTTFYAIISTLKELYPKQVEEAVAAVEKNPQSFFKCCGTKALLAKTAKEKKPYLALKETHALERQKFLEKRTGYLRPEYQ
jgi:uncharacterized protein YbbC (DUF1343 family)